MPVTSEALLKLEEHWAVQAVGAGSRAEVVEQAQTRLLEKAVGVQLHLDEEASEALADSALDATTRLALAYEQAAIENFQALLSEFRDAGERRDLAQSGASRAFELLRTVPLPEDSFERVFHALHVAALAYCSDRWPELRAWLRDRETELEPPTAAGEGWEIRLLARIYECWLRLLRKKDWDDLDHIAALIAGLRNDQAEYEPQALDEGGESRQAVALQLVALYHWARATELMATYMLQGEPRNIAPELDRQFDAAQRAAFTAGDVSLDVLLRWLHVAARRMVANSVWRITSDFDVDAPDFIREGAEKRGLFELLPPQRMAIADQGLLDSSRRAIVVDLPTSGGKTMLAELRILQALNTYRERGGWVAYVAPTRALVNQLTRRLRRDLVGVNVEQLSSSVEVDAFEDALLAPSDPEASDSSSFDVLVVTPEKLDLVIRGGRTKRPLALLVLDEAHNIEDESRGLRIELLLATVRRDCPDARYLLLMPHVPNADDLASWLGGDAGHSVSLGTSAWQPNDRIVGMFWADEAAGRGNWSMAFQSLVTTRPTLNIRGVHQIGGIRPLALPYTGVKSGLGKQAAAIARVMSERGTSIALARTIPNCWVMAREVARTLEPIDSEEITLVQRFLATEVSPFYELIELLRVGVGVHHTGLSDEGRSLIEWLAEIGVLKVLCATTGIAQGINFPVSSVFLGSRQLPNAGEMSKRSFWNLAGRAGRVDQDPVGVVGLARGTDAAAVMRYVSDATEDLVSRLVKLLEEVDQAGRLHDLTAIIHEQQWDDFRTYIAHLWNEHRNLNDVLAASEGVLRNTYGFSRLRQSQAPSDRRRADALLAATRAYAAELAQHPENATLADSTGFAPEGVRAAILGLRGLDVRLTSESWEPPLLFGRGARSVLPQLIGVMMAIPQLKGSLSDIASSGLSHRRIADLSRDWVSGSSIEEIAQGYFHGEADLTKAIGDACKAIYRSVAYAGTWGLSALSKVPGSGINFDELSETQRRAINNLPAMLYHGVSTEPAVLMRMNSVPRSVAVTLGDRFVQETGLTPTTARPAQARTYLRELTEADWDQVAPEGAQMSGSDYRRVWAHLSGEAASARGTAQATTDA